MKKTILLTRPRVSSERFAALLAQHGLESFVEPLLEIEPTAQERPGGLFQAVMITSAGTIDALRNQKEQVEDLFLLPCFCVGSATGDAAREFGFHDIRTGYADSADLGQKILQDLSNKNIPLLHIAGDVTDGKAQDILSKAGYDLVQWVVYHARAVEDFTPETRDLFRSGLIGAIPVFSPRSARILISLIEKNRLTSACHGIIAIGLSQAVADVLQTLPWQKLCAAEMPTDKTVLALLQTELSMIQTDPHTPLVHIAHKKRFSFIKMVSTISLLAIIGLFAFSHYPVFFPHISSSSAPDTLILEKRMDSLEARMKALTEIPSVENQGAVAEPALSDEIKNLQTQIAALQNQRTQDRQSSRKAIGTALAYWNLREAAKDGRDFSVYLTTLRSSVSDDSVLTEQTSKLIPLSTQVIPALPQLGEELKAQEPNIYQAQSDAQLTIEERLKKIFQPLISIHPLHDIRYTILEKALNDGDDEAASAAFKNLPNETQKTLSSWQEKLNLRMTLNDNLRDLDQSFSVSPTPTNNAGDIQ
jgi:uroporphyrinogen-III synthase